jgi:phospholipid/cholesterol/gamma-HCH transport system substrate-binding protein
METKANYVLIGAFTLAVIAGGFLFVLWFTGASKTAVHKTFKIVFTGSVSGLTRGSTVLFNGLNVGAVTSIDFLEKDPSRVAALIDIAGRTPVKTDTKARLELQGLTGVAAIALTGGAEDAPALEPGPDGSPPVINADRSDFQNLLENVQRLSAKADDLLGKANKLIDDNSASVTDTLKNADTFSKALADNSSGVGGALKSVAVLGDKIGPLADKLQTLSNDVDDLIKTVDKDKVRNVVANVEGFTATIAHNQGNIDSLLKDSAGLAKKLNDTAGQLDGALSDIRNLAKAIDTKKIADVVDRLDGLVSSVDPSTVHSVADNVATFTATLSRNQGNIDTVLTGAANLAKGLEGAPAKLEAALDNVSNLAKAIDSKKIADVVDRVDALVASVEPGTVHSVADNIATFTATLSRNQGNIDTVLTGAANLAKGLDGAPAKLEAALDNFSDLAKAIDAKKIGAVVDNVEKFTQALADNKGNVDRLLKDASELAAKLDNSADQLDGLIRSAQNFLGSPETKGALGDIGAAARSVRQFADDLDQRAKEIAVGLTRFSGSGLREYEALAIDARRTIGDLDRAIRAFQSNPNQLIFGSKPALPEYHGGQ